MAETQTVEHGQVAATIHARVMELTENENLTRTQAFQQVADEQGRQPGTVAANFYRWERTKEGNKNVRETKPRKSTSTNGKKGAETVNLDEKVQSVVSDFATEVQELVENARKQAFKEASEELLQKIA